MGHRSVRWGLLGCLLWVLSGCASSPKEVLLDSLGAVKDKALESVGLRKPELPESAKPDRTIAWAIQADDQLNRGRSGPAFSVVTRLYKLRSAEALLKAPLETFGNPALERSRLGDDLIETREIALLPGQRVDFKEKMHREVRYVAVVALFQNPAPSRWRYAFSTEDAEKSGISMGAHACSLTVGKGVPVNEADVPSDLPETSCP
jgi:type VI secretion system protein VasD